MFILSVLLLLLQVEALVDPRLDLSQPLFDRIVIHQRQLQKMITKDGNQRFKVFRSRMEDLIQSGVAGQVPVAIRTGTQRLGKKAADL